MGKTVELNLTSDEFRKDLSLIAGFHEVVREVAKRFNHAKGIRGTSPDQSDLTEYIDGIKSQDERRATIAAIRVGRFLQEEMISAKLSTEIIIKQVARYAEAREVQVSSEFTSSLRLLIEPHEAYIRRLKALQELRFGSAYFVSVRWKCGVKVVDQDGERFGVPICTIRLSLRDVDREDLVISFNVDDEDIDELVDELKKCKEGLSGSIEAAKHSIDVYRVNVGG